MAGPYSQDVKDRAREHVNEGHPHAEGAEWDRLFEEACRDLAAIDEHNDRAERAGRAPYGPAQRHSAETMASQKWIHRYAPGDCRVKLRDGQWYDAVLASEDAVIRSFQ